MAFTDLIQLPFSHLDNDEFNLAIFEFNQGRINFDIDRLESLHFNPLSNDNLTLQSFDIETDISEFVSKINEQLSKVSKEQKSCYLLGDFNIDLFKYQQHFHTNNYLDTMFLHCFLPLINRPTGITSHSASLIDNIFTNNLSHNLKSGILFTDISDHLPIFTLLSLQDYNKNIQNLNFIEDLLMQITKKNSRKN